MRTPEYAFDCISSGADIVHVGSAIEKAGSERSTKQIKKLVDAVRKGAKAKIISHNFICVFLFCNSFCLFFC